MRHFIFSVLLLSFSLNTFAELSQQEIDAWFNSDKLEFPEEATVKGKELQFIPQPQKQNTPVTEKTYRISIDSVATGWVMIEQCYRNLDPVPQLEVVYNYQHMRNLKVTQQTHVGRLWIEGQTVQMEDLTRGASICTSAEVNILRHTDKDVYLLLAGPFKRKFLDGYYPMHVRITMYYPATHLVLHEMFPRPTPGFAVTQERGLIKIDTHFSGELYLAMSFKKYRTSSDKQE